MDIVTRAREFAIQYHGDQKYGDKPYVYHLDKVASYVGNAHFKVQVVAYLHDVLEDTDCDYETVAFNFGEDVAYAVELLTKFPDYEYNAYISDIKTNGMAHAVKIADTKANLAQSVLDGNKGRIVKYAKQLVLLEN